MAVPGRWRVMTSPAACALRPWVSPSTSRAHWKERRVSAQGMAAKGQAQAPVVRHDVLALGGSAHERQRLGERGHLSERQGASMPSTCQRA